jgi:DNA-binding MarR family transcriptional regulator
MMYSATIAQYMVEVQESVGEPIDFELADAFADFLPRFKRWVEHLLPIGGPTAVRVRLLGTVHCEGRQKMSDLATALGVTARRVTALVDALEKEGLVARAPDPRDRRVTWISLTDSGRSTVDRLYQAHREAVAALFEELAPDRKGALLQSVRELTERLHHSDADPRRTVDVAV